MPGVDSAEYFFKSQSSTHTPYTRSYLGSLTDGAFCSVTELIDVKHARQQGHFLLATQENGTLVKIEQHM